MGKSNQPPSAADELRLYVERVERLVEEIKNLQLDVKDVFGEAKGRGFDVPTLKAVIKARKLDPTKRRLGAAMFELYMQTLGQSDGSLSDLARAFIEGRLNPADGSIEDVAEDDEDLQDASPPGAPAADAEPAPPPLTAEDAERMGAKAHADGLPVTKNPFPSGDARRAAWDEAWCKSSGSNGAEIPDWLRKPSKPEKDAE